ncbi:MAG: hypothetical protein H7Z14_00995 [Anaerolineae bacterium]|nr:hypothetical protein [Phycisphaerae bacterium]
MLDQKSRHGRARVYGAVGSIAVSLLINQRVPAGLKFWDGGGTNNNWSNPANWNSMFGGAPLNDGTDDIIMQGILRTTNSVDIDFDINSLQFSGGGSAGPFVISTTGADFSIRGGGIVNNDTDSQSIGGVTLGANQIWNAAAGPLRVNFVTLGGLSSGRALTIAGAFDTIIPNIIAGSVITNAGSIILNSTANLTLGDGIAVQSNSFTGPITVNSGTLLLNKAAGATAVPGSLIIGDGAGSDVVKLFRANQIADTSNITINSSGVFNVNGAAETINHLNLNGGIVNTLAGTLTVNGALTYNGGTFDGDGVATIAAPFAMNTQSMAFSGTPTVRFLSEMTLTAANVNTSAGTLSISSLHVPASNVASTIAGRLAASGSVTVVVEDGAAADDLSIAASVHGNQLVKTGAGRLRLGATSGNTLAGLVVNDGTAILHGAIGAVSASNAHVHAAANITVGSLNANTGGVISTEGFTISASGLFLNGGTVSGSVSASLGTFVNAPNSYFSGTLTLSSPVGAFIDVDGNASAVFDGAILHGPSTTLTLTDAGTITFAGNVPNASFGTGIVVGAGNGPQTHLILAKSVVDGSLITSRLSIGFESLVKLAANEQILADTVALGGGGMLDLDGFSETLSTLQLDGGLVTSGAGTLTVTGKISTTGAGTIEGNLRFSGAGIRSIDVASNGSILNIPAILSWPATTRSPAPCAWKAVD